MEHPPAKCVVCRETPTTTQTCPGCQRRVADELAQLLDLAALAALWLPTDTLKATTPTSGSGGTKEPPAPCDLDLIDSADPRSLLYALERWEWDWRDTFGVDQPGIATPGDQAALSTTVTFLFQWWERAAAEHPAADEFAHDVSRLHHRAKAAMRIDGLDSPDQITITCPADIVVTKAITDPDTGQRTVVSHVRECGRGLHIARHILWAATPNDDGGWDDRVLHGRVICTGCGTDWSVDRLIAVWRTSGQDGWVDAETAAKELGVDVRTIRSLGRRHKIATRYGRYNLAGVQR